jgi:peptidoglycan-associated lipoprotein
MSLVRRHPLPSVLALALVFFVAACGGSKRPPVLTTTPGEGQGGASPAASPPAQPVDEGPDVRAVGEDYPTGSDLSYGEPGSTAAGPLGDVHFDLDSAALTEETRRQIEQHALWLQNHRDVRVTLEGHCDERGTVEYNLALGEQRARAVRDYLVSLGVAADRLRTVSYGKERPLDPASNEAAWAKNRRVHFTTTR